MPELADAGEDRAQAAGDRSLVLGLLWRGRPPDPQGEL